MLSFKNIGAGFYAALGPKGRTDRFIVVRYADRTFDVLDVNAANRSYLTKLVTAGEVCRTPHGQDAAMATIGSRNFSEVGDHHFGKLRTIVDHLVHMAKVTGREDDAEMKAAIAFMAALRDAQATQ